jgi:Lytic transglycolase
MRTTNMRCPRTVRITAGALAIAAPASAVALTAGQADALSALQIRPVADHLGYGHKLTVTGLVPRSDGGYRLALEYAGAGRPWRTLAHTKVHSTGAFRLRAPLIQSGAVRVVPVTPPAPARSTGAQRASATSAPIPTADLLAAPAGPAPITPSPPEPVTVAAKLAVTKGAVDVLSGQSIKLRGTLLPRRAGAVVRLQTRARGRWRTVAAAHTRAGGRFVLRHPEHGRKKQTVRVNFAGDAHNAAVSTVGRKLVSLQPVLASWYEDAGNTACGFHAGNGVASPDLPCGTKVTFAYHGRVVTAVVDDRGPFVPGRTFDLNQNTAAALGFNGVDTVWSSV